MENPDEWESFIAEARARGYGSSEGEDEPIDVIPSAVIHVKKTPDVSNDEGPEDAEEAVRKAGVGMSQLSFEQQQQSGKRTKHEPPTPASVIPPLTPMTYSHIQTSSDPIIYNELAVWTGIGVYPNKHFHISDICCLSEGSLPALPSTIFLPLNQRLSLPSASSRETSAAINMSMKHLFTLCSALPPSPSQTPFVMQFTKTSEKVIFGAVSLPYYGDRGSALQSIFLPHIGELLNAHTSLSTVRIDKIEVSVEGMVPVIGHLPSSSFSDAWTALTALFAPNHIVLAGRLDPLACTIHSLRAITISLDQSKTVSSFCHVLARLHTLPEGDYTMVHRPGSNVLAICRERESVDEDLYPFNDLLLPGDRLSLDQLNK